jgi:hypothetical protein
VTLHFGIKETNMVIDLAMYAIENDLWKNLNMTEEQADAIYDIFSGPYDENQWFVINGVSVKDWEEVTKETEGLVRLIEGDWK